jgi:formylglycine-generating enzyme required for sulfatase activity
LTARTFKIPAAAAAILFGASGCNRIDVESPQKPPTVIKTAGGAEMVSIPGGWFSMGGDQARADESPVHKVRIDPFLMDRREVAQQQYAKLVIGEPSRFKDPRRPVEQIRWSEAVLYCNARSLDEGLTPCYEEETGQCNFQADGYRLPTEAEWEYACRAGTTTDYSFGRNASALKDYAWCKENSNERTNPVGQKKANPWGLFDMHGNVAEWCHDKYDEAYYKTSPQRNPPGPAKGDKRVVRGGAWNSGADACRAAYRRGETPGSPADACFAHPEIGFRCVRRLPGSAETSPAR